MDNPRIPQSTHPPLKPIQTGNKSSAATPHGSAPTESTTTAAGGVKGKPVSKADFASIGDAVIQDMTDLLPLQVLSSPAMRQAEWAWRQIISDVLAKWAVRESQLSQFYGRLGQIQNQQQGMPAQLAENVMREWWQTLSMWGKSSQRNGMSSGFSRTAVSEGQPLPQGNYGLLPFSQVTSKMLHELPGPAKHAVLLDRILSAVSSETLSQVGSGVFFPPVPLQERGQEPVHWSAERTVRLNRHGQRLDRLSIQFSLHDWPVEIVFLTAKPTLYVHVRSDHPNIQKLTSSMQPVLFEHLQENGWRLEQWSVSQWTKGDEE
ncbi:hypothetical protein [Alicyclobacillus sp. SO9]|uniref:hypothetical protein n=1 Tax=Alicyclobacillus sp. SO9 TaxID=2665646 RepID=UPI0018E71654|nr:hypothetical protein [Alicyclobacillus sp. SO9]QQE80787.1 hypothetical protein GI364_10620 [Alicyclobacillus sp. SO9]